MKIRIGNGYDVHRLEKGRSLVLGGVRIPFEKGLLGHSDADVLIHAIIDALLGALALGDIGKMFPNTDEAYLDASSISLLNRVNSVINENGYAVGNIDAIVVAQQPKLASYIETMRENIASAVGAEIPQISVKATTEERLGFTGEGRGIAAHAVCLLEKKGD